MTDYASPHDWLMWAIDVMARAPDQVIGPDHDPYMRRWFITPRSADRNVYLHEILRSDDDRALHDHPWDNQSLIIAGGYFEHLPERRPIDDDGGEVIIPAERIWRTTGWTGTRKADAAHRLELQTMGETALPCISLFTTGPKVREWGFHCPNGWRHWTEFTEGPNGETVGLGCE